MISKSVSLITNGKTSYPFMDLYLSIHLIKGNKWNLSTIEKSRNKMNRRDKEG